MNPNAVNRVAAIMHGCVLTWDRKPPRISLIFVVMSSGLRGRVGGGGVGGGLRFGLPVDR